MSEEASHERAVEASRQWLRDKGWEEDHYVISVSEVQSCPQGFLSVDVICIKSEDEDEDRSLLLKKSRVLEVDLVRFSVETVLAARDMNALKRILELERVRVRTEELEEGMRANELEGTRQEKEEQEVEISETEVNAMLLEQDPNVRLNQVEEEIERVRRVQEELSNASKPLYASAEYDEDEEKNPSGTVSGDNGDNPPETE
ncbi:hypothetical protein GUITHDRAFT_108476 [Guillardia theta CCMP2712]|uniref:Uncharacterized protein n=1 Tax=Guillardia theta (strain CCMP2712) TaxID=905079 RepID=L1JB99_GUITC|nr:hypothetical protein GUITHDRAFT_108476 [Guillardia theta CCMP2712]EKX45602.1 hypothetical protein GUITHDRAFT_108476 [Guillardia theta CCMP2712]|mmetsp:Transcript_5194/g.18557  ORF Transcript_5194/g.18557 Transcript_5194/m.18557 type:complete len:202 (-) Transcript_5194:195-800(-)|eukprot:XP_005832582.1 hypothetical protein GUITHDRAFT_108476 [Guillardia theta CCMP2712]